MSVTVIGFDPSISSYGISDGERSQRFMTDSGYNTFARTRSIFAMIQAFVGDTPEPYAFFVEGPSFGSTGGSAQNDAGYLMAWFDLLAERCGANVYVVPPSTLKKFVTGKGNTPKAEMPLRVFKKWNIEFPDDKGCDKLMAYCLHRYGVALLAGEIEHAAPKSRGQGQHSVKGQRKRARGQVGAA